MDKSEEFLSHYGVRGQKWGVRRFTTRSGKTKPRPSDEGKAARKILAKQKKFGSASLTNHELRMVNSRIKLEQEFHKLNPKPKSKLDKGEAFVKRLVGAGTTAVSAYELFQKPAVKKAMTRGKTVMTVKP